MLLGCALPQGPVAARVLLTLDVSVPPALNPLNPEPHTMHPNSLKPKL